MSPDTVNLGGVVGPGSPGSRLAFISLDDSGRETRSTFGELDALADGIARSLTARGMPLGSRIALLGFNSIASLATILGILRAGLVAVPINHRFPRALIHEVIADSGALLLFCDATHAADAPRCRGSHWNRRRSARSPTRELSRPSAPAPRIPR